MEEEGHQCRFGGILFMPDGERTARMCGCASTANRFADDGRYFSIWL